MTPTVIPRFRGLLSLLLFLATGATAADDAWKLRQGLHLYPYSAADSSRLSPHVLVFLPRGYETRKNPLIILLHGGSSGGDDVQRLRRNAVLKYLAGHPDFPFITASPQAAHTAYGAFDPASVNKLVDDLIERLPIDSTRIYITGASTGGRAAWQIAAERPERYAAIVPVSSARPDVTLACALKETAVWAFHNEKDEIQSLQPVSEMIDAIRRCDGNAKLTIFPKPGHDAWTEAYSASDLYEWLGTRHR